MIGIIVGAVYNIMEYLPILQTFSRRSLNKMTCIFDKFRMTCIMFHRQYFFCKTQTIVHFIYGWAHEQTSVDFCKRKFGTSKSTVVDWNNVIREVAMCMETFSL